MRCRFTAASFPNQSWRLCHMKKKRSKRTVRNNVAGFLFVLPWAIGFLAFSLYPIVMSAYYSFTDFSAVKVPVWVGLENYKSLFGDANFYKSLSNTMTFVTLTVPITIILSLFVAMLLKIVPVGRSLFRGIFYIPTIFPVVASTLIWVQLLDARNGYLNRLLKMLGLKSLNWLGSPSLAKPSLILITCWSIGSTVVILLAAMGDVSEELYEAASIDGANTLSQFRHITIPGIAHVLLYQIILALINGFQYFTQIYVLISTQSNGVLLGDKAGPENSLLVYNMYLFQNAFGKLEMGRASAMAWMLFLLIAALTFLLVKVSKRWVDVW